MSITMKNVAIAAGVSVGTVDRVLNHRGKVKEATRLKVEQAVRELEYESNPLARGLVNNKKPKVVAAVVNAPEINYYADQLQKGIAGAAKKYENYGLEVRYFYIRQIGKEPLLEILEHIYEEEEIDGLLMKPVNAPEIQRMVNRFMERGTPVVTVASDIDHAPRTCFVGQDNYMAGRVAASLLSRMLGKDSNIIVFTGTTEILGHRKTTDGFCSYMAEKRPDVHILGVMETYHSSAIMKDVLQVFASHNQIDGLCVQSVGTGGIEQINEFFKDSHKPKICTFGCGKRLEQMLRDGDVDFAIEEAPFLQGSTALKVMFNLLVNRMRPESDFVKVEYRIIVDESYQNQNADEGIPKVI